jgi:preprotein translocase subunit SecY
MLQRIQYTSVAVGAFLFHSHLHLYGNLRLLQQGPLLSIRLITAFSRYTPMEFGIGPLTCGRMGMSFLSSVGLIVRATSTPKARSLYGNTERLVSLAITACQSGGIHSRRPVRDS